MTWHRIVLLALLLAIVQASRIPTTNVKRLLPGEQGDLLHDDIEYWNRFIDRAMNSVAPVPTHDLTPLSTPEPTPLPTPGPNPLSTPGPTPESTPSPTTESTPPPELVCESQVR